MDTKTDPVPTPNPSAPDPSKNTNTSSTTPQPTIPVSPDNDLKPSSNNPSSLSTDKPHGSNKLLILLFVIVALAIGAAGGYFGSKALDSTKQVSDIQVNPETGEIKLPADAVQIQSCSDRRGKLYVKPSDIPVGPVYMVNNDKVIGIEYMLSKDEFLAGKSYSQLAGIGVKVNHVNIGLLSQGHEGYESPHFHVDMYTIPSSEADTIVCPKNPNATPTPSATSSAQPATASPSAKTASSSGTPR
jgi:hypothetical protein